MKQKCLNNFELCRLNQLFLVSLITWLLAEFWIRQIIQVDPDPLFMDPPEIAIQTKNVNAGIMETFLLILLISK